MDARVDSHGPLRILVADRGISSDAPVLLFLHGKGEASAERVGLDLVLRHVAPPFQALIGNLRGATTVAPQAPVDPSTNPQWSWAPYIAPLVDYLDGAELANRPLMASGFSRGGKGVLQLLAVLPHVQKWAVVDPQPGESIPPERLAENEVDPTGWLAYGTGYPAITAFSQELASQLVEGNVRDTAYGHSELARRTYNGDKLAGTASMYNFLGLDHREG